MFAKNVAGIDAKHALYASAEFLDSVGLFLLELPIELFWSANRDHFLVHLKSPRQIGHEILGNRESLHWLDRDRPTIRSLLHDILHSSHAHQARHAVDFSTA